MLSLTLKIDSITFIGSDTLLIVKEFTPNAARVLICHLADKTRSTMNVPMGCRLHVRREVVVVPLHGVGDRLRVGFIAPREVRISRTPERRISAAWLRAEEAFA